MRRVLPVLLLLAIGTASATGVLNVLLGMGAAPHATYNGEMTAAAFCPSSAFVGFTAYTPCGSLSVANDSLGHAVYAAYGDVAGNGVQLEITTPSDPGQGYFTTLTIGTGPGCSTLTSASASAYTYSGGEAQWIWNTLNCFSGGAGTFALVYQ